MFVQYVWLRKGLPCCERGVYVYRKNFARIFGARQDRWVRTETSGSFQGVDNPEKGDYCLPLRILRHQIEALVGNPPMLWARGSTAGLLLWSHWKLSIRLQDSPTGPSTKLQRLQVRSTILTLAFGTLYLVLGSSDPLGFL